MNPSWYDVLGVDDDATSDEIRSAWQNAVAGLDPTDRRFKQRNRAAEVLLDPARRAAHDAELAAQATDDEDTEVTGVTGVTGGTSGTGGTGGTGGTDITVVETSGDDTAVDLDKSSSPSKGSTRSTGTARSTTTRSGGKDTAAATATATSTEEPKPAVLGLTIALALLALLLVIATVASLVTGLGSVGGDSADGGDDGDLPDARAVAAARAAAVTAIVPVLSYDYRDLEQSEADAVQYLTPAYAEEYQRNFAGVISENAPRTKTIVTTEVLRSGIVRTGVDRVDVLVFVNRPTQNVSKTEVSRDQVTMRMVDDDGRWLVDCLITAPGGVCSDDEG